MIVVTALVYWNVGHFEFVNYDDPSYVFENPIVNKGLTEGGIVWGLTTSWFDFWHPLTWWSHMLDVELFGLRASYHHLVNLAFHIGNTLLLFGLLRRSTGALYASAVVAALFALHPMHAESVAWISERKDVLSTFFGLLCFGAYCSYVFRIRGDGVGAKKQFCLAVGYYVCALMAKASVVTWPFVMLLFDYWPLGRIRSFALGSLGKLVFEKWPFFALSACSCVITYAGMNSQDNIMSATRVSWENRLTNVPVSYVRYVGKLAWPESLAVLYPLKESLPLGQVLAASFALIVISVLVIACMKSAGYLAFGWFFFLGTLVPMIGIVAMGHQSIADRYSYIPSIGLFVAVVWAAGDLFKRRRSPNWLVAGVTTTILVAYGVVCWGQVQHWRDSIALWTQCLKVDSENAIAHYNLGHVLHHSRQTKEAIRHYEETIRLKPSYLDAHLNLGAICFDTRDFVSATNHFQRVLEIKPGYSKARLNMGMALNELKDYSGASNHLAQAVAIEPKSVKARCLYALSLVELGIAPDASEQASEALKLEPANGTAMALLARAYSLRGLQAEARRHFEEAIRLSPESAEVYLWAGIEALRLGDYDGAVTTIERATQLKAESAQARFYLAVAYFKRGRVREAIEQNRAALELSPDWPDALNNLAWLLATTPAPEFRNGAEAVTLARRACEVTGFKQAQLVGTLACAYAEAGQFDDAVATAERAAQLARESNLRELAETNEHLIKSFRERRSFQSEQ